MPIDLDGDGRLDIVSCHEGSNRCVLVHWNRDGLAGLFQGRGGLDAARASEPAHRHLWESGQAAAETKRAE